MFLTSREAGEFMKSDSPLSQFAIGVRDQIHEWATTRAEQQILSFVVQKQARQPQDADRTSAADHTAAWALDTLERNQARIAELEAENEELRRWIGPAAPAATRAMVGAGMAAETGPAAVTSRVTAV